MATGKFFILGIQSLISSEDSTLRFGNDNTIIIPFPEGVDELHKLSINFNEKGRIAKKLLEYFSTFKIEALLSDDGVVQKNGSHLKFENSYFDVKVPENLGRISNFEGRRIQIALGMKNDKKNAIIISKNPAFRMKLNSIQLQAQPFKDDIFPPLNEQYSARINCQMSEEKFDLFNSQGYITKKDIIRSNDIEWITNLFLNISSLTNSAHSILARYDGKNIVPLKFSDNHPFGISAKKAGQHMALEALLTNPKDAPIVIIKGSAGTGKTLLSLACGLNDTTYLREDGKSYSQIMITTPTETLRDENLGFLPGEFEEKFDPYLGGIMDNLNILVSSNEKFKSKSTKRISESNSTSNRKDEKKSEKSSRQSSGRSIVDTIFIIDEAQNIEPSVIKSIVTRAGEGSKFVFIGDPTQIDNPELNERYNGLVYLSEKMKGNPMCWQVTLDNEESVRSKLAYVAAKIL